jgi:hypothetical protein
MIMVVHQAIGVAEPAVAIHDVGQSRKEAPPVLIIRHNVLAGIAPTGDVIHRVGKFETERTGHGQGLACHMCDCKT